MSWADDIRCLYCDGKLPLYKKITNGQFCSSAHQKAYWHDQERLALERLRDSYPPSPAIQPEQASEIIDIEAYPSFEAGGNPAVSAGEAFKAISRTEPDLRGLLGEQWPRPIRHVSGMISAEPFPYEISLNPSFGAARFWAPFFSVDGQLPKASPVQNAMPPAVSQGARIEAPEISPVIRSVSPSIQCVSPIIRAVSPVIRSISPIMRSETGLLQPSWALANVFPISATGLLELPNGWLTPRPPKRAFAGQIGPVMLAMRPAFHRSTPLSLKAGTVSVSAAPVPLAVVSPQIEQAKQIEQAGAVAEELIPRAEKLHTLPRIVASSPFAGPAPVQDEAVPMPIDLWVQLPADAITAPVPSYRLGFADLKRLRFEQPPVDAFYRIRAEVSPLVTKCEAQELRLATPARRPRLRSAVGSRYSVEGRGSIPSAPACNPAAAVAYIPDIALPERRTAASLRVQGDSHGIPVSAGTLPLNFSPKSATPVAPEAAIRGLTIPVRFDTEPLLPRLRLEPQDAKPASDWLRPSTESLAANAAGADKQAESAHSESAHPKSLNPRSVNPWTHAVDFYRHAPRDLKVLAFAIPVLLSIALNPSAPKVKITASGGFPANIQKTLNTSFNDQWVTVRQTVLDRAAVALDEDFRSGLDNWMTRGDVATSWGFDATGFVRPGPLALYEPSAGLSDYQMQFLGVIDKKALSWVVRAADFDNYYVIKLVVLKPGPLPTVGITRYAVIHGKAQDRSDTVLPINARSDMLYRVSLDVRGEDFALAVQGQMVDNWSEPRLKRGGVGFFSARGEESRVRWVQVTHQYDMLGRLCAYLAPYNISTTDGGF